MNRSGSDEFWVGMNEINECVKETKKWIDWAFQERDARNAINDETIISAFHGSIIRAYHKNYKKFTFRSRCVLWKKIEKKNWKKMEKKEKNKNAKIV